MKECPPSNANERSGGLSRRSFLQVAVGSIVTLPAVAGGFLLPFEPQEALAAEGNTTKVIIAQSYEAGLCVIDTKDGKRVPVPNAKVTFYSHYNKKTFSDKTNAQGVVLLNLKDLAEKTTTDGVDRYTCYAQVDVEAEGFRSFRVRRLKVEGAKGFQIPTRKLDGETTYPLGVALDEWDILYTKNEFCITTANDAKHTFAIDMHVDGNASINASICEGDQRKVIASTTLRPKDGVVSGEIADFFLLTNHKSALSVGAKFYLRYSAGGKDYEAELQLSTVDAPTGVSAPSSTNLTLAPFNVGGMKPQLEVPKWVPVIGGTTVNVWTPDLPVEVMFNPFGYFKIAYRSEELGYKSKDGKPDPNAWKFHPRKTFEEQAKEAYDSRDKMINQVGQARNKDGVFKKVAMSKAISGTAMLAAYAAGRWDLKSALWRGQAGIVGTLAFNFSYAQQFLVGPVPMIFEFSFLASLSVGVEVAVSTPEIFSADKYSLDYGSTGISLTITIQPAVSLGVGVKGVLSASIKGALAFTFYLHCGPLPSNTGNNKSITNPHVVVGVTVTLSVVVQALIFTTSFNVLTRGDPKLYDNWKQGVSAASEEDEIFAQAEDWETIIGGTAEDPFEIISDESIAAVKEFNVGDWQEYSADAMASLAEGDEDDWESWISWGDGSEEQDDVDNWVFFDGDYEDNFEYFDDEDESYFDGFIYSSAGFEREEGGAVPTAKMVVETNERKTDDGQPYTVTAFRITTQGNEAEREGQSAAVVAHASEETAARGAASDDAIAEASAETSKDALSASADAPAIRAASAPQDESVQEAPAENAMVYAQAQSWSRRAVTSTYSAFEVPLPEYHTVKKRAEGNGLKPKADEILVKNTFGDPRFKTLKLFGDTYLFRIASVDVKNGDKTVSRTRVVIQKLTSEGKTDRQFVLDYAVKYSLDYSGNGKTPDRIDYYDYDFDVTATPWIQSANPEVIDVHFFIISGRRANGNETKMGEAACDQVFTHALWRFTKGDKELKLFYAYSNRVNDKRYTSTAKTCAYHNFSCPHIEFVEDTWLEKVPIEERGNIARGCVMTFLDRGSSTPEGVLKKDDPSTSVGLGLFFVNTDILHHTFYTVDTKDLVSTTVDDMTIFEMISLPPVKVPSVGKGQSSNLHVILMRGHEKVYYYVLHTSIAGVYTGAVNQDDRFTPALKTIRPLKVAYKNTEGKDVEPKRLVAWPGHTELLASVDSKLMKATIKDATGQNPYLTYEECGPSSFSIAAFGTDTTGNFIYWPTTSEGTPGYDYSEAAQDSDKAKPLPDVKRYQVMSCKCRNDKFTNPFVFAEVEHDMDSLIVVGTSANDAMTFVSSELTDRKNGKADLWYTSMPNVKCANVIGVECLSGVGFPGEACDFNVTVRNDGNTFLAGFTAVLREKGSKDVADRAKVVPSKDNLVESCFNPKDDKGNLQNVEEDYALAPGASAVYHVRLTIPKGWGGEKRVSITAEEAVVAPVKTSGVKAMADDMYDFDDSNAIEYIVGTDEGDYGEEGEPFSIVSIWYEDDLDNNADGYDYEIVDVPIATVGGESSSGDGSKGSGSDGSKGNGSSSGGGNNGSSGVTASTTRMATPSTADLALGFLPLAAAGAGILAYSRRRQRLEAESEDEE